MPHEAQQRPVPPSSQSIRNDAGGGGSNANIQVGRDADFQHATIVGGDLVKIKQVVRKHPLAAIALSGVTLSLVIYGGVSLTGSPGSGVDLSVVNQSGAKGAVGTANQIRAAERGADAASWCALVAPGDAGCAQSMQGQFDRRSQDYRNQVDKIGIGQAALSGTSAQVPLTWKNAQQGTVPLVWSGGRWQMTAGNYGMVKLAGGVFLSLVDSTQGQLKLGGIPIQ